MMVVTCRYQSIRGGSLVDCGQPADASGYCQEHRAKLGVAPQPPLTTVYAVPPVTCPKCGHVIQQPGQQSGSAE